LLRREREIQSLPPINVKRVYRVRDHKFLSARRIKQPGVHAGMKTASQLPPAIYGSVRTPSGSVATTVRSKRDLFLKCCSREAIGWIASPTATVTMTSDILSWKACRGVLVINAKHTGAMVER
jgi:putative transposase